MSKNADLLRSLRSGHNNADLVTVGGCTHDGRCLAAADTIQRLERRVKLAADMVKVTASQAADAVALIVFLADAATAGGEQANELRLGDAVVQQIVDLREQIKANTPAKKTP